MIYFTRCFSVIALAVVLLPYVTAAQTPAGDSTETAHRLFEEIPIEGRLYEMAQEMHQQLSQNPFGLPPDRNERMVTLFEQAFAEDTLLADAQKAFYQQYEPALADSALQWITTDSAGRVLSTEQAFYTLQGVRKRVVNRYEMEQDPPSPNRMEVIQSVSNSLSAVEAELETAVIIYRAIVSAFSELSDSQSFTESQIDGIVSGYRSQTQPRIEQEVINQLLLMYHGVDNDVLKQYGTFYETGPGEWLSKTTAGSIHMAYRAAADRFIKAVRNQ